MSARKASHEGSAAARFYSTALDAAERAAEAARVDGLDAEIALLRERLHRALADGDATDAAVLRNVEVIVRAVVARYRIGPRRADDLAGALTGVIDAVGGQLWPEEREV